MRSFRLAAAYSALLFSAASASAQTSASPDGGSITNSDTHSASPFQSSTSGTAATSGTVGQLGGSVISGPTGRSTSGSTTSPSTFTDCTGISAAGSPAAALGCE